MTFHPVTDLPALDAALARTATAPLLLFKHSATCGRSAEAYEEVALLVDDPAWQTAVGLVVVQTSRDVSHAIAARFAIRHESPQALLVADGQVRWHGSHHHVNRREIRAAIDALHLV